ncbi:hypothetical protein JB92DRAFT_2830149 [Gautieria morchelliformis]|nr:hypothetical protein JB92DRAFT_2830149 [Gautieria morchelliformis]
MFYVVTLSLRTISVIERSSNRRSSATGQVSPQCGALAFPQKFNEALVHNLFVGLSKPIPDHVTLPPRVDILPARILLFYFDNDHAHAVRKTKPINDAFYIGVGQYRRIVADIAATTETELRAFILAAGVVRNVSKLRKPDLIAALILGDYHKADAERIKITALHKRLELKAEKLRKTVADLEFADIKLAALLSYVEGSAPKVTKNRASSGSMGRVRAGGEAHPHRYPTRYSLTTSSAEESS